MDDYITVCAKTEAAGYGNSAWSEEKYQRPVMEAPELVLNSLNTYGMISWSAVNGATSYEYELDGDLKTTWSAEIFDIQYGSTVRVRAVCDSGFYEQYSEWTELVTREDVRIKLDAPVAYFNSEQGGLMVLDNDDRGATYQVKFEGYDDLLMHYDAEHTGDYRCLTSTVAGMIAYVRAVPHNTEAYAESDWTMVEISFG